MEVPMNHICIRLFLAACCGILLCMGSHAVFANNNAEVPFPEVVRVEQEENVEEQAAETSPFVETIGQFHDSYYLRRIHDDGYYHLVAYSDNGDVVQLFDASKWSIQQSGREKVLYWVQEHDIFIKPCASCFSFYQYVLYNLTKNEAVEANLIHPPLPMGAHTFRIINIQPYERLVLLSDNTVWQVGPDANFSRWQIGQRLLVGVNNKWRTAKFPHILINVDISGYPYSEAVFYGYPLGNY
jgi:hypothetical protein